jgi:hypothetical protein
VNEQNTKSEHINTSTLNDESMGRRILIVVVGLIEALLGFRFIFKLAGANPANTLITMLYSTTDFMVKIFASIFTPATNDGLETVSVIEPGTLIAMIVVALIALAISKLMTQNTSVRKNTSEYKELDQSTYVDKEEN